MLLYLFQLWKTSFVSHTYQLLNLQMLCTIELGPHCSCCNTIGKGRKVIQLLRARSIQWSWLCRWIFAMTFLFCVDLVRILQRDGHFLGQELQKYARVLLSQRSLLTKNLLIKRSFCCDCDFF